jgi:hypothetical protein
MADKKRVRLTLEVDEDLLERCKSIPWGLRSEIIRALLVRAIDAGERHGSLMYGAIMDGKFDLIPRIDNGRS